MKKVLLTNLKDIKKSHSERIVDFLNDNKIHGYAHSSIYVFNLINLGEEYFNKITLVEYYTLLFFNPLVSVTKNTKGIDMFFKKEHMLGIYLPCNLMKRIKNNFIKLKRNSNDESVRKLSDLINIFLATEKETFAFYISNLMSDLRKSEMLSEQEILFICLKWLSKLSKNEFVFKTRKFQKILEKQARLNIDFFMSDFGEIRNFKIH